jgi:steroid delta-isomerase-like uncharacterized protein
MVTRVELEALTQRWIEEGWRKGDAEAVLALYAPDFVDFSNPYAAPGGRPGTGAQNVAGIRALYEAFPDFYTEIDDLVIDVEAGKVAVRWTATGTHRGDFLGVAPSGRQVVFHGIETLRIADGMITERAGEWDGIAILNQISGPSG